MRIAELNGRAILLVKLTQDELTGDRPKWEGVPFEIAHPLLHKWQFIEIRYDLAEDH